MREVPQEESSFGMKIEVLLNELDVRHGMKVPEVAAQVGYSAGGIYNAKTAKPESAKKLCKALDLLIQVKRSEKRPDGRLERMEEKIEVTSDCLYQLLEFLSSTRNSNPEVNKTYEMILAGLGEKRQEPSILP